MHTHKHTHLAMPHTHTQTFRTLSFYVRLEAIPTTGSPPTVLITLTSYFGTSRSLNVTDYLETGGTPLKTSWQRVVIPVFDFYSEWKLTNVEFFGVGVLEGDSSAVVLMVSGIEHTFIRRH